MTLCATPRAGLAGDRPAAASRGGPPADPCATWSLDVLSQVAAAVTAAASEVAGE